MEYRNELGELHNTDGPAVEYPDGDSEWWVNGGRLTQSDFRVKLMELINA